MPCCARAPPPSHRVIIIINEYNTYIQTTSIRWKIDFQIYNHAPRRAVEQTSNDTGSFLNPIQQHFGRPIISNTHSSGSLNIYMYNVYLCTDAAAVVEKTRSHVIITMVLLIA